MPEKKMPKSTKSLNRKNCKGQQLGQMSAIFIKQRDTAVPAEGNGNLQTLICVLVARPRRCLTLSNPVP